MNKIRILVVEDEAIVALDIRRQLTDLGYEPAAQTMRGEDAVTLAEQLRPDLVLMDVQLTGEMDGIATAQEIRAKFSIPVVFLTAFASDEILKRAKLAEPYGYIIKPFEDRDLRTVIEMALYKHQAERDLKESHTALTAIVQGAMDGFYFIDAQCHFLDVNEAFCQMTGYSREELLGMSVTDLVVDETREQILAEIADRLQNGFKRFERRQRRKDGRLAHIEISPGCIPGDSRRLFGFARDITDRKRAEEETLNAASVLEAAFESTADALLMSNSDGIMTHYNKKFVALWNLPEEVLASGDEKLAIESVCAKVMEPIGFRERVQNLYTHPEEESFDVVELKNGRILERYSKSYRVGDRVVGRVWSFRDVTERKRLEDQLRQAQKMEAVGQLAGGVAHDFNNILAVILMQLGLLQEETALSEVVRGSLKDLTIEAHRAAALTRQLLAFSRRQIIQIKPVDLDALVENLLKMLRRLLGEHFTVDWQCGSGLPLLNADPGMVEQVVMNLCVNARDAMPHGGGITLSAKPVRIEENGVGIHPESRPGAFVRFDVTDTGCGMDEGVLKHIFEPFFTTKEVGHGTGLGLSTVHGIVKQHGGWIEVESVVGKGSSFHVFLPVCASGRPGENKDKSTPVLAGRGETILVVEDEIAVRLLVRRTLERNGYRVLQASSGPEALGLWRQYRADIDLLFSDVVMPHGMTGYQLAESLRKDKPGLKVILSTGYSDKLIDLSRQGMQTFFVLAKPYTSSTLLASLRDAMDQV
jgi:PAS domain S-box-containing protein